MVTLILKITYMEYSQFRCQQNQQNTVYCIQYETLKEVLLNLTKPKKLYVQPALT